MGEALQVFYMKLLLYTEEKRHTHKWPFVHLFLLIITKETMPKMDPVKIHMQFFAGAR